MIINYVPVQAVGVPRDAEQFPLIKYVLNLDPHLKFSLLSNWSYLRRNSVRCESHSCVCVSVTFRKKRQSKGTSVSYTRISWVGCYDHYMHLYCLSSLGQGKVRITKRYNLLDSISSTSLKCHLLKQYSHLIQACMCQNI